MPVPNTFANATTSIPLSQLDANFATPITLGNTAIQLGNTVTTLNNMTLSNVTITTGNVTVSNATVSGNLAFTGTGNRITGDFSNTTVPNRVAFQTSTVNGNTIINAIPNGTGTNADFRSFNNSDPTNAAFFQVGMASAGGEARLNSGISGAGTYAPMTFVTGGSERMRIDASGNVGIGTSSPGNKLDIVNAGTSQIRVKDGVGATAYYDFGRDGTDGLFGFSGAQTTFSGYKWSVNAGTEVMRITNAGNVGIGTAAPGYRLEVRGTAGTIGAVVAAANAGGNAQININSGFNSTVPVYGFWFNGDTGLGNPANQTASIITAGSERMRIDASGNVGIGTSSPAGRLDVASATIPHVNILTTAAVGQAAGISLLASATSGEEFIGYRTAMRFGTITGTNAAGFTERARITSAGVLQFATTAFSAGIFNISGYTDGGYYGVIMRPTANNSTPFRFENAAGGEVGTISCTSTNTSYVTSSDYRLKENVAPLTGAAARVQALKPSRFNFIADPDRTMDGFLAHEAAEVVPEAVTGEKDAVNEDGSIKAQGIDHSKLVPLLTAALQEALTEIASLKARVAALENK